MKFKTERLAFDGVEYSWTVAPWDYKGNAYDGYPDAYEPRDMGNIEIWDFVPNTDNKYKVSTFSKVKRLEVIEGKEVWKVVQPKSSITGYDYIYISKIGNIKLHQLMMMVFNPMPIHPMPLVIDHENDNPSDNRIANLHWVTASVNTSKSQGRGRGKAPRPNGKVYAVMYDLDWKILDCDNIMALERKHTKTRSKGARIIEVCRGLRDKYKNWRFRYFLELSDTEKEEIYSIKPELRNLDLV